MKLCERKMHLLPFLMLVVHAVAFYITSALEKPLATQPSITGSSNSHPTSDVIQSTSFESPPSVTLSSLMTIAPLSRNPLEIRQHCWNDQGFSVDCATWTGYYYTWGGAGHPYAGGPGDSGSGSGGTSNTAITGILGSANRLDGLKMPSLMAVVTLCLIMLL